jgi:hypothetical protein
MNEKYTLEELEAYLLGELELNRKNELEVEIKTSQTLQAELEALKISREAIELAGWRSMVSKTQKSFLADREEDGIIPLNTQPATKIAWFGRIAASLALVLVGFVAILFFSVSPESITSKQLDYSIPVMRSAGTSIEELENRYRAGNFEGVIALSSGLSDYDPASYFLIGLAHLNLENGAEAEVFFTRIEAENIQNSESNFADQVDYYLVKSYLYQNKASEAESRMSKILEDKEHTYHNNFSRFDLLKIKILKIK